MHLDVNVEVYVRCENVDSELYGKRMQNTQEVDLCSPHSSLSVKVITSQDFSINTQHKQASDISLRPYLPVRMTPCKGYETPVILGFIELDMFLA